jgi:NAD+ kinase
MSKRIALYVKQDETAQKKAHELGAWLADRQVTVIRKQAFSPDNLGRAAISREGEAPTDLFCVIVLGGDGTFLSAARWIGRQDIPIMGVKFGEIGFLAEILADKLYTAVSHILSGGFASEERSRLQVRVIREGRVVAEEIVLNEVVINKGALARLASIETWVNSQHLTTYKSDGLIVASPTGSTAYSLAAGGPIIHPGVPGIILSPICPFTLTNRCMVLPDSADIRIGLDARSTDIVVTFDGQVGMAIDHKDTIHVVKSAHPIRVITQPHQTYFDVLKTKLRWSGKVS